MWYHLQVLLPSASPSFQNSLSILHQVPEGHVGVYWRGGALLKTITEPGAKYSFDFFNVYKQKRLLHVLRINFPGFHLKMPFITQYEPVQVTLQTDMVSWLDQVQDGNFSFFWLRNSYFWIMVTIAGDRYTLWY